MKQYIRSILCSTTTADVIFSLISYKECYINIIYNELYTYKVVSQIFVIVTVLFELLSHYCDASL